MFKTVKKYYDLGYYTNDDVKIFVQAKYITADEYLTITGVEYIED